MNTANIAILYRFYFKRWNFSRDMIYDATETVTYEDGLTTTEYHLSDIFVQNVCDIRDKHSFYQFCRALNKNRPLQDTAREKEIILEIRKSDTKYDENDLEDADFVYNWYLADRVDFFLKEKVDFFLNIMDDIHKSKESTS